MVGFNHVALEVGDIEEALAFYRRLFDFELRGKSGTSAFIDLGLPIPRPAEGSHSTRGRGPPFWTRGRRQECSPQSVI
jgi:catechol 2,3-dioxygenase-like lactoylglutathione lyase family enzyme